MKLLALDSATDLCSAALWLEGELLEREQLAPRLHGQLLLPMVQSLLEEAAIALAQLDAVAFGRGPGAFTGLRLAAAVAQGLGFSIERPLIAVSDLQALALRALEHCASEGSSGSSSPDASPSRVLVCQDARMAEVYWGTFACEGGQGQPMPLRAVGAEQVSAPEAVRPPPGCCAADLCVAGSGLEAYPAVLRQIRGALGQTPGWLAPQLLPRAREVARLAAAAGLAAAVSPEQALPVYLRDQVATAAPRSEAGARPSGG